MIGGMGRDGEVAEDGGGLSSHESRARRRRRPLILLLIGSKLGLSIYSR